MSDTTKPIDFPASYDPNDTVALAVPRSLVTRLAGDLLARWERRATWETEGDWEQGRQAAYLLQERLVT